MNFRLASLAITSVAVVACASAPPTSQTSALEPAVVGRYVLPASFATDLTAETAVKTYIDAAQKASRFYQTSGTSSWANSFKGKVVSANANRVVVRYVSESGMGLGRIHNLSATIDVSFAIEGQQKILTVRCPDKLEINFSNGSGMGTWPSLLSPAEAAQDLKRMCTGLRFDYAKSESGEYNAKFNDTAVFANFARKLPIYRGKADDVKQYDIAKYKWFSMKDGEKDVPVGITVFPYRTGSKVAYVWVNRFVCTANAPCELDRAASQRIAEQVALIAND